MDFASERPLLSVSLCFGRTFFVLVGRLMTDKALGDLGGGPSQGHQSYQNPDRYLMSPSSMTRRPEPVATPAPSPKRPALDVAAGWLLEALLPDPVPATGKQRGSRKTQGEAAKARAGIFQDRAADIQAVGRMVVATAGDEDSHQKAGRLPGRRDLNA
jgi:hypothetical protein